METKPEMNVDVNETLCELINIGEDEPNEDLLINIVGAAAAAAPKKKAAKKASDAEKETKKKASDAEKEAKKKASDAEKEAKKKASEEKKKAAALKKVDTKPKKAAPKKNISENEPNENLSINIMDIIEKEDKELLENNRIATMSRIDWGKTMAVSNQYIQRNILRSMLEPFGYSVYSTDDADMPAINIANNSPGFDLLIVTPENKHIRIQSKLRQVDGKSDCSKQTHFETTRRNSEKNKDKNHTGHVCYSLDEFDFAMVSLVNDKLNRDKIKNCNLWSYCLIPIMELEDKEHNCCYGHIKPEILQKNIIKITDDIRSKI